jgi:phospholipid/cholesterol/gamma-HCH transport system substrate-binding protein
MAVSDEESVKALNESLKKLKDITTNVDRILTKVDNMADKTDSEIYGKEGALPQVNVILKDIIGKLQKLDKTVDNINKISTDASEGTKDLHILRSGIDDTLKTVEDAVRKLDAIIGLKKAPEFKVP